MPTRPAASTPDAYTALQRALQALDGAEGSGHATMMSEACQRLAACYRRLGELPAAIVTLERALRWSRAGGAPDQALDLQCEMAESLADLAEQADRREAGSGRPLRDRARDEVFDAARQAERCADPRWEVTVLLRLSDILDRFGDRDDATTLQVRALQLTAAPFYTPPVPRAEDAARLRPH